MNRGIFWISLAVALGALSAASSYWISRARAQAGDWTPFTAVMVERDYQRQPAAPLRIENYIYSRRGDGSWVRDMKRQIMPNGGWGDIRVVMDYPAGTRTAVDPSTESLTTYHYAGKLVARLSISPQTCTADPNAKHAAFLDYDTVVVEQMLPGPGRALHKVTEWRAPALNCFPLKQIVDHEDVGVSANITREALLVKEGDPSAGVFEIPSGYVERAPSEVMAEWARRFPEDQAARVAASASEPLDQAYRSSQRNVR